jgi:hypothetical protein
LENLFQNYQSQYSQVIFHHNNTSQGDFLQEFASISPVNLLCFGFAGATKSSFINTVFTTFGQDDKIANTVKVGGNSAHVTTNVTGHKVPNTNVTLWDSWGLTRDNWADNRLELLLSGSAPAGMEMLSSSKTFENFPKIPKIDGVLFFCPQAVFNDPNAKKYREILTKFWERVTKFSKIPVFEN